MKIPCQESWQTGRAVKSALKGDSTAFTEIMKAATAEKTEQIRSRLRAKITRLNKKIQNERAISHLPSSEKYFDEYSRTRDGLQQLLDDIERMQKEDNDASSQPLQ